MHSRHASNCINALGQQEQTRFLVTSRRVVPSEWKKACTILIHKKGETNDPANVRPITLESILLNLKSPVFTI